MASSVPSNRRSDPNFSTPAPFSNLATHPPPVSRLCIKEKDRHEANHDRNDAPGPAHHISGVRGPIGRSLEVRRNAANLPRTMTFL